MGLLGGVRQVVWTVYKVGGGVAKVWVVSFVFLDLGDGVAGSWRLFVLDLVILFEEFTTHLRGNKMSNSKRLK